MQIQSLITILPLLASSASAYVYCTFYENLGCTGTASVAFNVDNSGCFKAAGKAMKCHGTTKEKFKLVQSPNSAGNCNCQSHCATYDYESSDFACVNLGNAGYNLAHDTYRFIAGSSPKCSANNC